jgi:hypothetical protein
LPGDPEVTVVEGENAPLLLDVEKKCGTGKLCGWIARIPEQFAVGTVLTVRASFVPAGAATAQVTIAEPSSAPPEAFAGELTLYYWEHNDTFTITTNNWVASENLAWVEVYEEHAGASQLLQMSVPFSGSIYVSAEVAGQPEGRTTCLIIASFDASGRRTDSDPYCLELARSNAIVVSDTADGCATASATGVFNLLLATFLAATRLRVRLRRQR